MIDVVSFFRAYKVKIPNVGRHQRDFVLEQIEHITRLKNLTPNIEINTSLDDVLKKWNIIAEQNGWLQKETKPKIYNLNFKTFIIQERIPNPNIEFAVDLEHADELLVEINRGLDLLESIEYSKYSPESLDFARRRLRDWRMGFSFQKRRAGQSFGVNNVIAKGPSAKQLQKKMDRRTKDAEYRMKMKRK